MDVKLALTANAKSRLDQLTSLGNTAAKVLTPAKIVKTWLQIYLLGLLTLLNYVKEFWSPLYRMFFASRHPVVIRTPDERFVSARLEDLDYPYPPNYVHIPYGSGRSHDRPRMHYVDEYLNGDKYSARETILCLHGEPTWSFAYRKMIPCMAGAGYRVIVPDMIGFGKSDKYYDMDNYNHELHIFALKHLLEELDLNHNITLIAQGWGGVLGLSLVKDMPDKFSNLILMNTGLPTGLDDEILRENPVEGVINVLPFFIWRSAMFLFGTRFPLNFLLKRVFGLSSGVANAYTAPYPDSGYMAGVAKWPQLIPIYNDDPVAQHMVEAKSCLRNWLKPVLLVWGEADTMTQPYKTDFKNLIPQAKLYVVKGAGHVLQETHGADIAQMIVDFLSKKNVKTLRGLFDN